MRGVTAAALAIALALALPGGAAAQAPVTQPACVDGPFEVSLFKAGGPPGADWRENLAFDGLGGLWITNTGSDRVERYGPDGAMTSSFALPGVAGIARGPDGMLYLGVAPAEGETRILRFDPASPSPSPALFVSGTPGANGMTFDAAGNLYTASDVAAGIGKVRPDGSLDREWIRKAADIWGPNGLAIVGGAIYTPITFDQRSPIERVPLDDPDLHTTLVHLSFGTLSLEPAVRPGYLGAPLVPKGLDDLDSGPDRRLYVTAFLTGELLRVDPVTGFACVAASGLVSPTSARFARSFGAFEADRDLFVTEASGNVRRIRLPAPGRPPGSAAAPLLASSRLRPEAIRRGGRALLRVSARARGELRLVFRRRAGATFVATVRRGPYRLREGKRSIAVRAGRLRPGRYTVGLEARRAGERSWRLERTHRLRVTAR